MNRGGRKLTRQIVVRIEPDLDQWLDDVSTEDGRTKAQTVRWLLRLCEQRGIPQ